MADNQAPGHPNLPPHMAITERERNWALELKRLVEESEELAPITDMEYAQHAIISQGNTQEALHRIQGLQQFKELYQVNDSVDEGLATLARFIQLQPRALIYLDICRNGGEGVTAVDQGALFPSRAKSSEMNFKIHILAYYYMYQIMQPNLHACREGVFLLIEGHNMVWENFDMTHEQRLHNEFWMYYPVNIKRVMIYNSNSVVNLAWSLLKPLLSDEFRGVMDLGCQIELDQTGPKLTLADLYFTPTYDMAMLHLLERAKTYLTMRYFNTKFFRL